MTGGADGGGQILIKLETSFMRGFLQLHQGTKLQDSACQLYLLTWINFNSSLHR